MKKLLLFLLPLAVTICSCNNNSNKQNGNEELLSEQENEMALAENMNVAMEEEEEEEYILEPGVTYITTRSEAGTDMFGGKVRINMEFTIYTDGSATGNLVETNSEDTYGNSNSYNHPLEGEWEEVSKHDKRYIEITLALDGNNYGNEYYYNEFTYYIDKDLNVYGSDDLNNSANTLRKK